MKNNHVNTFENFETNLGDPDAFIYGIQSNKYHNGKDVYIYDQGSDADKFSTYEAMGKKLYAIDSENLKVIPINGRTGTSKIVCFLKPELAEKLNKMGELVNEKIKAEKEQFVLHVKKTVLTK